MDAPISEANVFGFWTQEEKSERIVNIVISFVIFMPHENK